MKLNRTGSNWTELERNKINENWDIIEGLGDSIGKVVTGLVWKTPVDTVADLPTNAEVGETRMVREADPDGISYVYRYDGEKWEKIQAIDVTLVNEVDRRLTAQLADKANQIDVKATNLRVDELIIESGDANAEVSDSHVSLTKAKRFPTLPKRLEEIERDSLLMENRVQNGDFTENSIGWFAGGSTHAVVDGKLRVTGNGAADYSAAMQNTGIKLNEGDKWFIKAQVTPITITPQRFRIVARGNSQVIVENITSGFSLNEPFEISAIYTAVDSSTLIFGIQAIYDSASQANGAQYHLDKVVLINLSEAFGRGYEKTKQEMLETLKKFDYKYFEGRANAIDYNKLYTDLHDLKTDSKNIEFISESVESQIRRNQITTRTPFDFTVSSSYTSKKRLLWTITYDDEAKNVVQYGLPIHQQEGVHAVFYAIPNRIGTGNVYNYGVAMDWSELKLLRDSGWEIGHHTYDHLNTSYMDRKALSNNIEMGNHIFMEHGFYPNHFSHPGGSNNYNNSNVLKEYFDSAVLTVAGDNEYDLNPWRLKRRSADAWHSAIMNALTSLSQKEEGWLISYHHAIHPDGKVAGVSGDMACWTPTQLKTAIQHAKSLGIEIVTMNEGLRTYAPYLYYFDEVNDPAYAVQRNGVVKSATPIA